MNHLLFGFALCAAVAIYPGGLSVLVAQLATAAGRFRLGAALRAMATQPLATLVALGLAGLVVAPLPLADNPVAPVGISWAAGSSLGNLGLSLAGLWALCLLAPGRPRRARQLWLLAGWSLGLLLLSLGVRSGDWSGLLSAGGAGAESARLVLGVAAVCLLWCWFGPAPGQDRFAAAGWAVGGVAGLILVLPQLQTLPFLVDLAGWWTLQAGLGLLGLAAARLLPPVRRRLGRSVSAATLNTP